MLSKITMCTLCTLTALTMNAQSLKPAAGPKGLYGYRDSDTGEWVIPHQYDVAYPFNSNGFAYVAIDTIGSYIDKMGNVVVSNLPLIESDFSDGLAVVCIDADQAYKFGYIHISSDRPSLLVEAIETYKYGYIDTAGNQVIAPKFDMVTPFHQGLALVTDESRHYYINTLGETVIDINPKDAHPFSDHLAFVKNEGLWGCIDQTGKLVVDYRFNMIIPFSQGIAAVRLGSHWGYITNNGEMLLDFIFKNAGPFRENRASIKFEQFKGYGYIDKTGIMVIPVIYDAALPFADGVACVQKDGKWGYIDSLGNVVINLQFDRAGSFSDGLASVYKNDRYDFIDRDGKVIVNHTYQVAIDFSNGLACVGNDGKYGFIDVTGNLVIPMIYDEPTRFNQVGLAWVSLQGEKFLINKRGKEVAINYPKPSVDIMPKFQEGDRNSFSLWVGNQIKYPPELRLYGVTGTVLLSFIIDVDGSVTDIEVVRSVHPILDEEAIRVISSSPKWTPGYQNGRPLKVRFNFPVIFQLHKP